MYYSVLTTALCISLASMAVYACEPEDEILRKYCECEVVFIGVPVSGDSALSTDRNGASQVHQRMTFQVSEYYQTNNYHHTYTEVVSRTHTDNDNCDEAFVPESDGPYLVLASGGIDLSVPACDYVIPSQCTPSNLQDTSCRG